MVICKSPLTDAVACSNSGGYWGPELKFAGYDMVILEGKAQKPVYIWIENDTVEIRDAAHVWGKNTEETEDMLRAETDPQARISGIGPAGENLNRVACVINDKSRAAGRSGVGAVMGSKNVKAIAVRGTGAVQCADPLTFGELVFQAMKDINASPTTSTALRGLGTASTVGFTNSVGHPADEQLPGRPVRARQRDRWPDDRFDSPQAQQGLLLLPHRLRARHRDQARRQVQRPRRRPRVRDDLRPRQRLRRRRARRRPLRQLPLQPLRRRHDLGRRHRRHRDGAERAWLHPAGRPRRGRHRAEVRQRRRRRPLPRDDVVPRRQVLAPAR